MLTLRAPDDDRLAAFVAEHRSRDVNYTPGLLHQADERTRRWIVDRHRAVIGRGPADFTAATNALRQWKMFNQSWAKPALPFAGIAVGATVGYSARVMGCWWSYCCRIVSVIDTTDEHTGARTYGFDYGTLRGHAERGEERFLIEYDPVSNDVTFSLLAMSRPGRWFTWVGLPVARMAQARFRRDCATPFAAFVAHRSTAVGAAPETPGAPLDT